MAANFTFTNVQLKNSSGYNISEASQYGRDIVAFSDKYLAVCANSVILIYTKNGDYFNTTPSAELTGQDILGGTLGAQDKLNIDITDNYLAVLDTRSSTDPKLCILKKNDSDDGWTRIALVTKYNANSKVKKWNSSQSTWIASTNGSNEIGGMNGHIKIIGNTVFVFYNTISNNTYEFNSFFWMNINNDIDTNTINNANNLSDLYIYAQATSNKWQTMNCDDENLYLGRTATTNFDRILVIGKDESDGRVWILKQTINIPENTGTYSYNRFGTKIVSDNNTLVVSCYYTGIIGRSGGPHGVLIAYSKINNTWGNPQTVESAESSDTYFPSEIGVFGNIIVGRGETKKLIVIERSTNPDGTPNSWETASKRSISLSEVGGSYTIYFNNHQAILNGHKLYNNSDPWVDPAETAAINVLGNTFINTLKLTNFSTTSTGFKEVDSTRRAEIKSLLASASDKADKRSKRLNLIKYLFLKNKSIKNIRLDKEDLDLPSSFVREKAVIVKAGETFNVSDLSNNEGFYAVLKDDESVSFTLDNVTVKFTRNDDIVSSDERYYITDENDDDLNTDNVNIREPPETNQGTFSDTDTSGYLVEDDIIIIDGRKFLIGSVGDGQNSSGSAGDPYVFPLKSNTPVKLPNKPAIYRMFEQGDNYVNVEVGRSKDEHKQRMFDYARKLTPVTHNIVMDGYFYKKLFISAEGNDIVIDYDTKKASCNEEALKFFEMTNFKKRFECGEFFEDCMCYNIKWKTCENKRVDVQVLFFANPHIENGINIMPQTLKNTTGMMIDNYKPKLMEIPSLTTKKFSKLHRKLNNSKNIFQKMNIKGKNEKWHFN